MEYRVRTASEIEAMIRGKSHEELVRIVDAIAGWLWLEDGGDELYINPEKEWEPYTMEGIADELLQRGISPEDYDMPVKE